MTRKPLFLPLKREFFEAFDRGTKHTEFRQFGPRWNLLTCVVGRDVVLSLGYGKQRRLRGVVTDFRVDHNPEFIEGWKACFPNSTSAAACIGIKVIREPKTP